jgi:N-acetylglucosamine repressor
MTSAHGEPLFREKNVLAILNSLRQEHRISRADIARQTGLTPATVSSLVARLEERGIVQTVGPGLSRGGRRPLLVEFHPEAFYLAGLDIGVYKAIALVIDLHGSVVSRARIELSPAQGREESLRQILAMTRDVLASLGPARGKVMGIGVSAPGVLDPERGLLIWAPNLRGWQDTPLVEIVREELGMFCCLEHDAKAMALGEARLGAGRGRKNIFSIIVGHGIGAGILINGELYHGFRSTAGEFGHITVNPAGPICNCGNRGCLEVMASGRAIAASAIRAVHTAGDTGIMKLVEGHIERITAKVVAQAAADGDELALRLMREAAEYIGIGLADVLNLLSPELVILGGGVANAGSFFIEEIERTALSRSYPSRVSAPEFALSALGENASAVGAAILVLEKLLETPLLSRTRNVRRGR